jgi:hypothetical protein
MSTDTITQFSEQETAQSPNGEQGEAPKNCRFEWVAELPKGAARGPDGSAKQQWLSAAINRLSERPGTWAMILSYNTASTASSRIGSLRKQFPELEFTSRKNGDGAAVYARVPAAAS